MLEANNQKQDRPQPDDSMERMPAMSKDEADAEIRQLGVTQEQLDMDISHLDMNDLVDPKYLPAIAAKMIREGKMLNFRNPRVVKQFGQIVDEAFEKARCKQGDEPPNENEQS